MSRTVIAIFESVYMAKKAHRELLDLGFPRERIDISSEGVQDSPVKPEPVISEAVMDELRAGISIGAGIGASIGIAGGLLVSLGVMHLPLLTAVTAGFQAAGLQAAGSLRALADFCSLSGAGALAGMIAGMIFAGLIGLDIPELEIQRYAKTVRRDPVTMMVVADWDAVDGTIEVLEHHNPLEIRQRAIEWQKAGEREKKLAERALHVKVTGQDRPR